MRFDKNNSVDHNNLIRIVNEFFRVAAELSVEYGVIIGVKGGWTERLCFKWNEQEFEDARTLRKHLNNQAFL